jgi:hypothetical protein
MGIGHHVVEALIRENQHRPIRGDVVLIGRQTVFQTPESVVALLAEHGADVKTIRPSDIKTGGQTTNKDDKFITDTELFRLLGVQKVLALDHSDYEGAELIHDLTKAVPPNLQGCADFILDGSTLDNVFDPAMVISNYADMLRPGGRLLTVNMYSNDHEPYAILPPLWYLDYFTMNGFADCKVYIIVYGDHGLSSDDVFTVDIDALLDPARAVKAFKAPGIMATLVLAEKGSNSTSHIRPSQQHYRSDADWAIYRANLAKMKLNARPHLARTQHPIRFEDVRGGHLFMASDFTARDPMTEILARRSAA